MKNKLYSFQDHLQESLKNANFKKEWQKSEVEYQLAKRIIEARLAKKYSQRQLAKSINTSPAVISRIETMTGNPSIALLKRIAFALDTKLSINLI